MIVQQDSLEYLKTLEDSSIDHIITDPPYLIDFMGKGWDSEDNVAGSVDYWKEALRVCKSGSYALVFGHSRTHHRVMVAMENAGWEIRDCLMWLYGSGFPKSQNIGKAVDKIAGRIGEDKVKIKNKLKELYKLSGKTSTQINKECGFNAIGYTKILSNKPDPWTETLPNLQKWNKIQEVLNIEDKELTEYFTSAEREVIGTKLSGCFNAEEKDRHTIGSSKAKEIEITTASSNQAKEWEGWGSALKPAYEPIIMARKPFKGSLTENVLKNGLGGLNIDSCRVGTEPVVAHHSPAGTFAGGEEGRGSSKEYYTNSGRFPANIILSHSEGCVLVGSVEDTFASNDFTAGTYDTETKVVGVGTNLKHKPATQTTELYDCEQDCPVRILDEQSGITKSSPVKHKDKHESTRVGKSTGFSRGNDTNHNDKGGASRFFYTAKVSSKERGKNNTHPTIKPIKLMEYLVKLISKEGQTILDPFAGSGSTGLACINLNRNYVLVEREEEYVVIIKARINAWKENK